MKIKYRLLERDEIALLSKIDRTEELNDIYILIDKELELIKEYYKIESWIPEELLEYIERLKEIYDSGGYIYGAFTSGNIVGMTALDRRRLSGDKNRYKLDILYISNNYRRLGIGKKLVDICLKKAGELNGDSIYISATPFKNTIDFYKGLGGYITDDIDKEMFIKEPTDIHMEIDVKNRQD